MFEGDSADLCGRKFSLLSVGGQAEGLACADPGARTPIGASGNLSFIITFVDMVITFVTLLVHFSIFIKNPHYCILVTSCIIVKCDNTFSHRNYTL